MADGTICVYTMFISIYYMFIHHDILMYTVLQTIHMIISYGRGPSTLASKIAVPPSPLCLSLDGAAQGIPGENSKRTQLRAVPQV